MQVIPVIDIRGGLAVAAHRGDRARYRPLETPLARGSDPVAVALGFRALFPFPLLYVADLDGIEGRGADHATQERLAAAWPGSELWIDDGSAGFERASVAVPSPLWGGLGGEDLRDPQRAASPVIGSESVATLADYESARRRAGPDAPLSLDFRGDAFVGPPELLENADLWAARIIVMTLARVGSGEGPDTARLGAVLARAQGRAVYAAGGVRHAGDLETLRDLGVAGALVATALHAGRITPRDLERLAVS